MEAREVVVWQRLVCPGQQSLQKGPWCCVLLVRFPGMEGVDWKGSGCVRLAADGGDGRRWATGYS